MATAAPGSELRLAMLYTRLGDRTHAIDHLERAYAEHSGDMVFINVDPTFDSLHGDARFQALVQGVGVHR